MLPSQSFSYFFLIFCSPAEEDNMTQVVFGVVFNSTIPRTQLPENEAVVQTLVDAANSNNNYSVKANSVIHIIGKSTQHLPAASLTLAAIGQLYVLFLPFPQQVQYFGAVRLLCLLPRQRSCLPAQETRQWSCLPAQGRR